jgi:TBC1 domain family member 13
MAFFYMALDHNRISAEDFDRLEMQAHTKKSDLSRDDIAKYIESHSDALARVLFIFAQLNKGIRYVQGMNEVIAILYYCFWKFGNEGVISTHFLESDLFFCFSNLMQELKDGFLRELDKEDSGLQGKCKAIDDIVEVCDPKVSAKLKSEQVVT